MSKKRTVFYVSDSTGITAEMLGHSLLAQFKNIEFNQFTLPFVDSLEKAGQAAERINMVADADGIRPIVFSTLVNREIVDIVSWTNSLFFDCLRRFITPLEEELGVQSSHTIGSLHGTDNPSQYYQRMDAINFALTHDDGLGSHELNLADIVLCGVSRCGKTPTCLYMAMQFGIKSANYPLIPEDLEASKLPKVLDPCRSKLYGLTIEPSRLQQIRNERRPGSNYASFESCEREVKDAERLMRAAGVTFLDTTTKSIEELATTILHLGKLERHIY